ncbi:MAG: tetratricopeptide repeat protein, partial [bacterium]|nr:tetratricopeptide repeat protein [bacterium]
IPAADLYARLSIHYKRIGIETKADAVAKKVVRLLRIYRRRSKSPEPVEIASRLLVDMGYAEVQMRGWLVSIAAFGRVLDFNARSPIALHMLAARAEKQELYSEARKWLERLLAVEPDNRPARLRLAVVLAQRGKHRQAVRHLETVIAGDDPGWAIIVACQELARIDHQQGRSEQAIVLLREARRRFPDDPQLVYLLASLLRDRPAESMQVLRALSAKTSWEGPTPRAIYNNWPIEGQKELIQQRRRELAERLPLLVEALKHRPAEPVK